MKKLIYYFVFFILFITPFQSEVSAQIKRFIILSKTVDQDIDSAEAFKYGIFQDIKNFHSAAFYLADDNSHGVLTKLKSADGTLYDSSFAISAGLVNKYIGILNNNKEVFIDDELHLAFNNKGLKRPIFPSMQFNISAGLVFVDLAHLKPLLDNDINPIFHISTSIQIPIIEDPAIYLLGGNSIGIGNYRVKYNSYSALLIYRHKNFPLLNPIFGLGIGYSTFSYYGNIHVAFTQATYPSFILGLNIFPETLDVIFSYPLLNSKNTKYGGKTYSINIMGPSLKLMLTL